MFRKTTRRQQWVRQALEQYEGRLMRYATRLMGDSERAKDVVQDTFLRLCQAEPKEIEGHLVQWLFTVCRNRALDIRRKEQRMTPMQTDAVAGHSAAAASEQFETKQQASQLLSLLGGLPENQQEVLRLKFQSDLSYADIAKVTGLTPTNVGYLIHVGIKQLRQEVAAKSTPKDGGVK